MGRFMEWTSYEIEEMKIAFLQGEKIKVIAKKLGRTPTALNKALSRFGVRSPRKSKMIQGQVPVDWKRYLLPENVNETHLIVLPSSDIKTLVSSKKIIEDNFLKNRKHLQETNPTWVPFAKILNYLEKQGYRVTPINTALGSYELDKKPVEKGYLLLLANRLRVEEAKPIFLVNEITW